MADLKRFRAAQDAGDSGFESALEEIRSGGKRSHWIWYVFPQIAGLGMSSTSQYYAIADRQEAIDYLRNDELRGRLLTITQAAAEQLATGKVQSLRALMGGETDARKLVSSLTLFAPLARELSTEGDGAGLAALADAGEKVLGIAEEEGYPRCRHTMRQLA